MAPRPQMLQSRNTTTRQVQRAGQLVDAMSKGHQPCAVKDPGLVLDCVVDFPELFSDRYRSRFPLS